ncbi:MAG: hypothetical protein KC503_33130 [Myxococcales bacterium]|nr:hypothetical protein [Myxococcales bacterium]
MEGYRIIVRRLVGPTGPGPEGQGQPRFVAEAPELRGARAEGATREEAVLALEDEIAAVLANMRDSGTEPPRPVDDIDADGELSVRVSAELHRELLLRARVAQVELDVVVAELLGRALGTRGSQPQSEQGRSQGDDRGDADRSRRGRGRGRGPQGRQYHNIMEDGASFREYVRSLEQDGGNRRGSGSDRGGGRGGRGR